MPIGTYKHKRNQGFQIGHKIWLGKKLSAEHISKLKGKKKPRTPQQIERHRQAMLAKNRKGINNPRWKGGYENKLWHNRQRRIKRLGNGGSHTQDEWERLKAQYNWTCPRCHKKEPEVKLTVDHIISLILGGSDNIENIQPLCKSCNSSKHDKVIKYKL